MTVLTTAIDVQLAGEAEQFPVQVLHHMLDDTARVWPDARAVRDPGGGWTYAELAGLSHAVARWLRGRGVGCGDRVLLRLHNARHILPLMFGLSRIGAVFVPINPAMKPYHLRSVVADCTPVLAVVDGVAGAGGDGGDGTAAGGLDEVPTVPLSELWPEVDAVRRAGALVTGNADPDDVAALIYTSGSTAAPKAVVLPHAQMAFAAQAVQAVLGYQRTDVVFCGLPLSFDYGLYQILLTALAGAELVLAGDEPQFRLLDQIRTARATVFPAVPSLAGALARLLERAPGPTRLRMITNTGAALAQDVIDRLRVALPGTRVVRMYGTTECKRITIMPPAAELDRPGSVGRALPGTRVLVLDDGGAERAPGHVGEIVVTGPHVMRGYWRQPELTARTFRRTTTGEVRLHTGDYGWLDEDGYLYFNGRRDDLFKRRGTRMSCIEIEAAAMDIPGVNAAAVLPPEGDRDLTLFVVGDLPATVVLRRLAERLEPAKVPATCQVLPSMPLTPNGKSAKEMLRTLLNGVSHANAR
jgi:acyl-CoA synthetase (AMP-forming)/AMP-acid ligase II